MKHALIAAVLVLTTGTLVSCGDNKDDSGASDADASASVTAQPTDASEEDFCAGVTETASVTSELATEEPKAQIAAAKAAFEKLAEVGTPEGIPDDARLGFELLVDTVLGIDDGATQEEIDSSDKAFSETQQKEVEALYVYASETCADLGTP